MQEEPRPKEGKYQIVSWVRPPMGVRPPRGVRPELNLSLELPVLLVFRNVK